LPTIVCTKVLPKAQLEGKSFVENQQVSKAPQPKKAQRAIPEQRKEEVRSTIFKDSKIISHRYFSDALDQDADRWWTGGPQSPHEEESSGL
jgi:hypothetical protein